MNKPRIPRRLIFPCPFCDKPAKIKACRGNETYFWICDCEARGFIPEWQFKELDRLKKISVAS